VDLGTNSIRLLVARFAEGEPEPNQLARDTVITRIGQGVDKTGQLAPEALRRTVRVLDRFCRRARALGAERIHLAATSAVRDASNRADLAEAVERLTGEPMEVLTGEEEAALAFLGATRGLGHPAPYLVMDVGGGSTEFVMGDREPSGSVSAQIGSVRLTERYVHTDPPSSEELDKLELAVTSVLHQVEDRIPVHDALTLVGVAGTSTTLQALALGLPEYDPEAIHRSILSRDDAESVFRLLADMTTEERRQIAVIPPGREDVIVAGATILVTAMRRWGLSQALISETDMLDGIAYRMIEPPPPNPMVEPATSR
jgi:exopolyphosphatase/guanosine-5'-triphosphate,3'-diphosphate pyrophosphatase